MRKHEENDCVRVLTQKCHLFIDGHTNTIRASRNQSPGNKAWGRIDYLMKVHGYRFIWDNTVLSKAKTPEEQKELNKTKRTIKKMKKDVDSKPKSKKR